MVLDGQSTNVSLRGRVLCRGGVLLCGAVIVSTACLMCLWLCFVSLFLCEFGLSSSSSSSSEQLFTAPQAGEEAAVSVQCSGRGQQSYTRDGHKPDRLLWRATSCLVSSAPHRKGVERLCRAPFKTYKTALQERAENRQMRSLSILDYPIIQFVSAEIPGSTCAKYSSLF